MFYIANSFCELREPYIMKQTDDKNLTKVLKRKKDLNHFNIRRNVPSVEAVVVLGLVWCTIPENQNIISYFQQHNLSGFEGST